MDLEIPIRSLGQKGLEDTDSAKKVLVDLVLYRNIMNDYVDRICDKLRKDGIGEKYINDTLNIGDSNDRNKNKTSRG
jgi:hypothetical protein